MSIRQRFRSDLPRGGFGRSVATLAAGTGLGQIILVATAPMLTRIYAPADFGSYAAAASILSILITLTCLRYDFAIPLPESDVEAANILAVALLATLGTTILAAVVLWLIGPWLIGQFGAVGLAPYVMIIPLGQFGGGVVAAFTSWAVRTKAFSEIATTRVTQVVSLVAVQLALGVARLGALGLLIGDIVGRVSGSSRLARATWKTSSTAFRQVSREGIGAAIRRYRRFPLYSSGSALFASLGVQLPLLCLVAFYGPVVGGEYALAARIGSLPLALVAGAVGQVFVADAARLARMDASGVESLFRRTTKALARAAFGPAVLLALAAPIVVGPIFGAPWQEAGFFIAILVPSLFLEFVIGATGDVLYVLERQRLHLVREIVRFTLIGGAIPLAAALGLPATGAIVMLSVGGCLTYGAYGLISWRAVQHHSSIRKPADAGVLDEPALGLDAAVIKLSPRVPSPRLLVSLPSSRPSERRYIVDIVLREWLGFEYSVTHHDLPSTVIRADGYATVVKVPDSLLATADPDWLTERSMPTLPLARVVIPTGNGPWDANGSREIPVLFGSPGNDRRAWHTDTGGTVLAIDVFGSAFWMLTRYEEVVRTDRDSHDRFPAAASLAVKEGFISRALVDEYVDVLFAAMQEAWPQLERPPPTFRLSLTHDIDRPFAAWDEREAPSSEAWPLTWSVGETWTSRHAESAPSPTHA